MKKFRGYCFAGAVAVMLAFSGCGNLQQDYVDADELTYQDLAPVVEAGAATLPAEDGARKLRTLKTWRLRLDKAKGK